MSEALCSVPEQREEVAWAAVDTTMAIWGVCHLKDVGPTNSWPVGPVQATRSYRIILLIKEHGEFLNQSGSQVRPCRDAGPSRWASAISQTEGSHSGRAAGLGVKGSLERAGGRPVRTRAGPVPRWLTFNGGGPTVFNICIFSLGIFWSNL